MQLLSSFVLEDNPSLDVGAGGASWPLPPTPHPRQTRQVDATQLPQEPGGWSGSGPLRAGSRAPGVVARPTSVWPPFPPSTFAQDSWKNCRNQCEGSVSQLPPAHTRVHAHAPRNLGRARPGAPEASGRGRRPVPSGALSRPPGRLTGGGTSMVRAVSGPAVPSRQCPWLCPSGDPRPGPLNCPLSREGWRLSVGTPTDLRVTRPLESLNTVEIKF